MLGGIRMDEQLTCSNCGAKVEKGETFCRNCGQRLETADSKENGPENLNDSVTSPESVAAQNNYQRSTTAPPPKSFNKKLGVSIGLIIVILLGGYFVLNSYYQPQKQLNRVVEAMGNPNEGLAKYVTTDDPTLHKDISDRNLKPTQKYFKEDQQKLAALKAALKQGTIYKNSYTFEKSGNAWLFFPRYKLNIKGAYVKLRTNRSNAEIFQNGKKVFETSKSNSAKEIGPLFPGNYTFKVAKVVSGRKLSNSLTTIIYAGSKSITLNLKTVTFTLHGDSGANVYLNNKKVGSLNAAGVMKFNNYPLKSKLRAYLIDSSKKKSKTINIGDELEDGIHHFYFSSDGDETSSASSDSSSDTSDSGATVDSQVDTKNLTTKQVNDWIFIHLKANYDFSVTEDDFIFEQQKNDDGLLEVNVRENHDSENMRAQNASPDHNPGVGSFVIDADGQLRNAITNEVIATEYGK